VLELDAIRAGYRVPTAVIEDVSLQVARGEIVALLGANGSGKTTTLRVISGLLKPWEGGVALEGGSLRGLRPWTIVRRGIALVPEGRRVFPGLTVAENLEVGGYALGSKREIRAETARMLELLPGLQPKLSALAGTLSGGQQQMLALGRALMSNPTFLLLDEPSLGLAPKVVDEMFDHIADLRATGLGVLLVEQNALAALDLADRAYVLERGRIVTSGHATDLIDDERLKQAFLGPSASDEGVGASA
jgi:branched-chain amino acid transport system ATP-binding protein